VFLQEALQVLFESVPLAVLNDMQFQHSGTSAHCGAQAQQHLITHFLVHGMDVVTLGECGILIP
jgi:hypothetical protein